MSSLIILFSVFYLVTIVATIFFFAKNDVAPLVSGSANPDQGILPMKKSYVIRDFHEKRKYSGAIENFTHFKKFIIFGDSLSPLNLHCGDGVLAEKFSGKIKKNIKDTNVLKVNDIIILGYKTQDGKSMGYKLRRFISFIDLSLPTEVLCETALKNTPKDTALEESLRVNQQTVNSLKRKIEICKEKLKKGQTSNYMLSLTYKHNPETRELCADYSLHDINKLFGKIVKIIPRAHIGSEEIINEFNKSSEVKEAA